MTSKIASKSLQPAIGYIYITQGTKAQFRRDRNGMPGFKTQVAKIRWIASKIDLAVSKWFVDHNTGRRTGPFDQGNFVMALYEAERQSMPLLVADFFGLAGRYGMSDGLHRITQLNKRSVSIFDATSTFPVRTIKEDSLKPLLARAVRESEARGAVVRYGIEAAKAESGPESKSTPRRRKMPPQHSVTSDHALQIARIVDQIAPELPASKRQNYAALADALNSREINTRTGRRWTRQQLRRVLLRAEEFRANPRSPTLLEKAKTLQKRGKSSTKA